MESKIGKKLFSSYLILILITIIIVGGLLSPLLRHYLVSSKKNELIRNAKEISKLAGEDHNRELDRMSLNLFLENIASSEGTRYRIIDKNALLTASKISFRKLPGRGINLSMDEAHQVLLGQIVVKQGLSPEADLAMISVIVPIITIDDNENQEITGAVLAISPVYLINEGLKTAYFYLVLSSLVAVIVATFIASYFSKKITLPLKNMNQVALNMAQGNYKAEIGVESDDELGELANSLNLLARQLGSNIKELKEEKGKMESIVLSINEGLIAVNRAGEIVLANPVIEKLFVINTKKIIGQQLADIAPTPRLGEVFEEVISKGTVISERLSFYNSTFKIIVSPIRQDNGNIMGAVGILRDVSELERVEQLRRNFIANVSHELRAPITVIRGYINCLLDGVIDSSPNHYYSIIRDETQRMEGLIKDLMDLSLLQAGKVELQLEQVEMDTLIEGVIKRFSPLAKEKNIHFGLEVETSETIAYCDGDRIEQLLVILIDNALKFTPSTGKINISLQEEQDKLVISIADTGIGIPAEDIPLIWERFYKVDKSRKRDNQEGTGLGLSIAKQIIELHRAEIEVASTLGQGSIFTLKLNK